LWKIEIRFGVHITKHKTVTTETLPAAHFEDNSGLKAGVEVDGRGSKAKHCAATIIPD